MILKILDLILMTGFVAVLVWGWRHQEQLRRQILENDAMPREASRGLVYGLAIFLVIGFLAVHVYWLF